jgi:quercetin dioxygenase-like cupin family protein
MSNWFKEKIMKIHPLILTVVLAASCPALATPEQEKPIVPSTNTQETLDAKTKLKPGSNEMLRAPISMAEGLKVIISDVIIPPNASLPLHYHPGEEFIYVLEGSTTHIEEGKPEQTLKAGDTYVIPPGVIHAPRSGKDGARAIVFRVNVEGKEEQILVEDK